MISDKSAVQSIVSLLKSREINNIVLSPGSRNAPFVISLQEDPFFTCYTIVDERVAGFFAMGMAQQLRQATVLVCTSGSAALNYAPAIAEAFYQHIPLLILTADRPIEWIDRGEGQSIRQRDVYANYIRASYELVQESWDGDILWHNELLINQALEATQHPVPGPVHINVPFREPLYQTQEEVFHKPKQVKTLQPESTLSHETWQELRTALEASKKILVLTGLLPEDPLFEKELDRFAHHPNVLVLTETTSNLHSKEFIDCIDRLIITFDEEEEQAFQPDLLITVGGLIVSKKIKALLRLMSPKAHWHVSTTTPFMDTFQSLSLNIPVPARDFFAGLNQLGLQMPDSDHRSRWQERHAVNRSNHERFIEEESVYADMQVFNQILTHIPDGGNLQMGNSSVVRYVQLYGSTLNSSYNANRGTSGIDGVTSTAVGAAVANKKLTTVISGDLAFFYDSNALWNPYLPPNLKIILINNQGGSIFRIIPGPSSTNNLEESFEAHHSLRADLLAQMYGIPYQAAHDAASVEEGLEWMYDTDSAAILEIFTPREENDAELKRYFAYLKANKQIRLGDGRNSSTLPELK